MCSYWYVYIHPKVPKVPDLGLEDKDFRISGKADSEDDSEQGGNKTLDEILEEIGNRKRQDDDEDEDPLVLSEEDELALLSEEDELIVSEDDELLLLEDPPTYTTPVSIVEQPYTILSTSCELPSIADESFSILPTIPEESYDNVGSPEPIVVGNFKTFQYKLIQSHNIQMTLIMYLFINTI